MSLEKKAFVHCSKKFANYLSHDTDTVRLLLQNEDLAKILSSDAISMMEESPVDEKPSLFVKNVKVAIENDPRNYTVFTSALRKIGRVDTANNFEKALEREERAFKSVPDLRSRCEPLSVRKESKSLAELPCQESSLGEFVGMTSFKSNIPKECSSIILHNDTSEQSCFVRPSDSTVTFSANAPEEGIPPPSPSSSDGSRVSTASPHTFRKQR